MSLPEVSFSNRWGECLLRPGDHCTEIRWFDTTSNMSGGDFNDFLREFATTVESAELPGVLVDAAQFRMDMSRMDTGWRDTHIIPRYNAAGVKKFAFIVPADMPAIGKPPAMEGPADFPTAYFASRAEALAWLSA